MQIEERYEDKGWSTWQSEVALEKYILKVGILTIFKIMVRKIV